MKTQISRDSFDTDKRYSGVYLQQGRMITDADWNEQADITRLRLDDAVADLVTSGVPRSNGVRFEAVAGQPLRLRRGRVYAEGVGALVTGTGPDPSLPFGLAQQADFPLPDAVVPPATDYRLYADIWQRAVTSIEDAAQLRDPAFHGADTAGRTQTMVQLKWCAAAIDPENTAINPRIGDARLRLTLRSQLAGLDPCDPCAREIVVPPRIGNYLFRLEVHSVDRGPKNPTRLVLKWSGENGAEAHAVGTEPADFKGSDWVYEYFTTRTEQHLGVHLQGGITPLAGTLIEGFPPAAPDGFPFVRRWDGYITLTRQGTQWTLDDGRERGVDLSTSSADDADGHVEFSGGALVVQLSTLTLELTLSNQTSFVAGDYWLADVRESVHEPDDIVLDNGAPVGVRHSYLLLGTVDVTGVLVPADTNRQQRLDFPSLTTLAARDVDYTAACPSGLFDATHDTVQKALDRVCGINATHVGFSKPCDTSIFKGVDPNAVSTVAKALGLLCDVRAEQIAYTSTQACTTLSTATTVQQALDLLCLHESAAGCRTTIGVGGHFPTLEAAVDAFLTRGETALCFCLLPGEHVLGKAIALAPKSGGLLHFALEGCGPASALRLDAPLVAKGCTSVRINDLAITVGAAVTLEATGGEQVIVERCRITTLDHDATAPMTFGASRLVRLEGNDLQAARQRRLDFGRNILSVEPALRALFVEDLPDTQFRTDAAAAATKIARMPQTQRRKLATTITKEVREHEADTTPASRKLMAAERQGFDNILRLLPSTADDTSDALMQELLNLRAVLLTAEPTLALVLAAEGGQATLTGNRIVGEVSLYAKPGEITLTEQQLKQLRARLAAGAVVLQSEEQAFVAAQNQISRLRVSGDLIIQLRDLQNGTVAGLFRTVRLTDNVFTLGNSDVVTVEATLAGNRFAQVDSRLATVIAGQSFYIGNHLPNDDVFALINVSIRTNAQTRADLNSGFIRDA